MCMITPDHTDLAYSLTEHYFGEIVASVVKTLFNYDQASLRLLKFNLPKIRLADLKKSLLILVKYQLVDYVISVKNCNQFCEYSVVPNRLFSFFRISKYIQYTRQNENFIARKLLTILAEKALITKDKLLEETISSLDENKSADVTNLNERVSSTLDNLILNRYLVHNVDISINIEKFNRDFRDDLVANTICDYYNHEKKKLYHLCRVMLELTRENTADDATLTAPVPLMTIFQKLSPKDFESCQTLERYLKQLTSEDNNRFMVSCGRHDNKGLMYAINVGLVIDYLVKEHLSSMITTRFGPKCCRVFRVLLQRGPLLLKQIEEIIMLPARDVREYTYMLIKEGYIRNRQVPKTPDNAPGKSVFIMSVELDQVVYSTTDSCCRSINNLLVRYKYELQKNKSLLERSKAVQELLGPAGYSSDNPNSLEEWGQYFNSHELAELNHINQTLDKILIARTQVDEQLFLFHSWINIRRSLEADD